MGDCKFLNVLHVPLQANGCDSSNAFVLPSEKRVLIKKAATYTTKSLSRKQRKRLEKVIDKKKKKTERGDLIEKLISVQVIGKLFLSHVM